jgi:Asp-tRNA(Asn)/Glu-tRNA(Gln) amidotransferase A subunit family amidase
MLEEIFRDVDVLLAPCVNGEAPAGLDYAGDPAFQALWTMLHVPTLSLPTHRGPNGMPVGIQLAGPVFGDKSLLHAARWIFGRLGSWQRPADAA